jgi:effector-binding domain-containing protein
MDYAVSLVDVVEQPIAAARQRTTFAKVSMEIRDLLSIAWGFLKQNRGLRDEGHNVAIYWEDTPQGSIECGVQVVRRFEASGDIVCTATPGGRVATTAHYGDYGKLGAAHDTVREWCKRNGHRIAMPFWEVYGDWHEDPAKVRTDVYYRVI